MSDIEIIIKDEKDLKKFYNKLKHNIIFNNKRKMKIKIKGIIKEEDKEDLLLIEKTFNIKDNYKRLEFIYNTLCEILDKYVDDNICEFDKNGLCLAQRAHKHPSKINGCCGTCKYVSNKGCTIKSLTCKTFYCNYIKEVKIIPNFRKIKIYKYFLTVPQKLIVETNFWNTKEENMKLLYKANIFTWLFKKDKKMKRF